MSKSFVKIVIRTLAAIFAISLGREVALAGSAEQPIRQLLRESFDKPGSPLVVDPIVLANDYAIADWIQEGRGGRALLRRRGGQWSLILCSGDGIKSAAALRQAGVPESDSTDLAERLEAAESTISSDMRAVLSTFEGTVVMGDSHHDH